MAEQEQEQLTDQDQAAEGAGDQEQAPTEAAAPDVESVEPAAPTEGGPGEEEPLVYPGFNWFVLRVASNKEDYVRATLTRKIAIEGLTHLVNRILVPTEKVKSIKGGKQRVQLKKLYPGYVFVEMKLEEDGRIPQDVFFLIKETTGVGDFIGTAGRPAPMQIDEVQKMLEASKAPEEEPEVKMEFAKGDHIKITDGPFENTEGTVDELLPDQGKVRVTVTIFGRSTPLELEYWMIEKADQE